MLYDYKCQSCGNTAERSNRIAERHTNAPECCGQKMGIYISQAPMGYMGRNINYLCPVTGQYVTSKKQRREIMAREGLVSAHEMISSKEYRQKQVDKALSYRAQGKGPKELTEQVNKWAERQIA